jgi:hypothetical protein
MKLTPDIFAHLTHYLKGLANGKVMVFLEVRISFQFECILIFRLSGWLLY